MAGTLLARPPFRAVAGMSVSAIGTAVKLMGVPFPRAAVIGVTVARGSGAVVVVGDAFLGMP